MGLVYEEVRLSGERGAIEVRALIDTGANQVLVPKELAEQLGIRPMFKVKAELADGSVVDVDAGPVYVEIMGRGAPAWVAIVEKGEVCIGAEALETLGLTVNPATGRVYPTRRFVWRI